jgi:hypothetical protein
MTLPLELKLGEATELHIKLPFGSSVDVQAVVRNKSAFRHGFEFADHTVARQLINRHCGAMLPSDAFVTNYWIVDSKNRIVIAKFGGRLTIADAERFAADLRNNPAFEPSFSELSDLTEVDDPQIDYASAVRFARYTDPFSHASKRAVVAPKPAMYNIARMYQLIRNDENIVLFKTVDLAKGWLGLSCV